MLKSLKMIEYWTTVESYTMKVFDIDTVKKNFHVMAFSGYSNLCKTGLKLGFITELKALLVSSTHKTK